MLPDLQEEGFLVILVEDAVLLKLGLSGGVGSLFLLLDDISRSFGLVHFVLVMKDL